MEAQEDPGREGTRLGEDPLARSDASQEGKGEPGQPGDGDETSVEEFVEDMESDPARAGTDTPGNDLLGG